MSERVVGARDLNRAVLARQLLLERRRLPIPRALERIAGLQAQYAPSAYVGLWSRLEGFRLTDLTRALERRRAVQATLMRSTIHVVSAADFWPFAVALRRERRDWWERTHRRSLGTVDLAEADRRVRDALGDEVRGRDELLEAVRDLAPERPAALWNAVGVDVVRAPPSGTWERRRADLYALAEAWIGPTEIGEDQALDHLLQRYLGAFGPAPLSDAADWAGVRIGALRPSAERVRLRRLRDEEGRELLDLPRAPLPDGGVRAPVRFLPTWDAALLVHARRSGILPERLRPLVFDVKTPHSVPTFLVDGAVAGTWRVERSGSRATLVLRAFERVGREARRELAAEGQGLLGLHEPDATATAVSFAHA